MKRTVITYLPRAVDGKQRDMIEARRELDGRNPKYRGCTREHFVFACDPPKEQQP